MAPRWAVHVLGLGNVVAGALLASGLVLPAGSLARDDTRLLAHSAGLALAAVGAGAWIMPGPARPAYLWVFGVALKAAGALLWGASGLRTGHAAMSAGAAADALVAVVVAAGLLRHAGWPGRDTAPRADGAQDA